MSEFAGEAVTLSPFKLRVLTPPLVPFLGPPAGSGGGAARVRPHARRDFGARRARAAGVRRSGAGRGGVAAIAYYPRFIPID